MPVAAGLPCFAAVESGMEWLWRKLGTARGCDGVASSMQKALRRTLRRALAGAGRAGGETRNLRVDRAYARVAAAV